ncbi:MAG: hypothetical protein ACTTG8_08430, partial [Catonella sp.]
KLINQVVLIDYIIIILGGKSMEKFFEPMFARAEARGEARGQAIGEARGEARGQARGEAIGENFLARLISILLSEGKNGMVNTVLEDEEMRHRLYEEYGIK